MSVSDNQRRNEQNEQNQQKTSAQWREVEPRDSADPTQHARTLLVPGAGGWFLLGASRRGKLHAHEGAYREDEFAFAVANGWNFAAIADGAGSRPMARVGAKEACCGAVAGMARFVEDPCNVFMDQQEAFAKQCLYAGFAAALQCVTAAAVARGIRAESMSATLLMLAHRPAQSAQEQDFVVSAQIGDGLLIAIDYRAEDAESEDTKGVEDTKSAAASNENNANNTERENTAKNAGFASDYSEYSPAPPAGEMTDPDEVCAPAENSARDAPQAPFATEYFQEHRAAASETAPRADVATVLLPLAAVDMGYYANETQFFPDLPQDEWESRMRIHELPPGAFLLMGMTDGVADDMYPITRYIPMLRDVVVPALQSSNPETQLLDLIGYDKRDSSDDRTLIVFYQKRFIAQAAARGKEGGNGSK